MISTRFYLDCRDVAPGKPGRLKFVISIRGKRSPIGLDISLLPSQWDSVRQMIVKHPRQRHLNPLLLEIKLNAEEIITRLRTSGAFGGLSAPEIKRLIAAELFPETKPETPKDLFLHRFDTFAKNHSTGTQRVYAATKSRLLAYLGESKLNTLRFSDITVSWLREFDAFLAKTSKAKNARNIHFRNIRAVFNDAITDELITCYPFRKFKLTPEPTRKRALTHEQFRALMTLELEPWEERYRDCFKLIFALCGINIVDLCNLKNVVNGRAEYQRAKTHRLYSILLTEDATRLMKRYKGKRQQLNYLDTCKTYRAFYSRLCGALRSMGQRIGVKGLSTYWARHTWATFASHLDIPKETIAAALGHGGHTVTDIYIDFDERKVDAANAKVMALAQSLGF